MGAADPSSNAQRQSSGAMLVSVFGPEEAETPSRSPVPHGMKRERGDIQDRSASGASFS